MSKKCVSIDEWGLSVSRQTQSDRNIALHYNTVQPNVRFSKLQ